MLTWEYTYILQLTIHAITGYAVLCMISIVKTFPVNCIHNPQLSYICAHTATCWGLQCNTVCMLIIKLHFSYMCTTILLVSKNLTGNIKYSNITHTDTILIITTSF